MRQSTGVKTPKIIAKTTPCHLPDNKNQTAAQSTFKNRGERDRLYLRFVNGLLMASHLPFPRIHRQKNPTS
jgi:hypothetical protein